MRRQDGRPAAGSLPNFTRARGPDKIENEMKNVRPRPRAVRKNAYSCAPPDMLVLGRQALYANAGSRRVSVAIVS